jgi:hypothetical protein
MTTDSALSSSLQLDHASVLRLGLAGEAFSGDDAYRNTKSLRSLSSKYGFNYLLAVTPFKAHVSSTKTFNNFTSIHQPINYTSEMTHNSKNNPTTQALTPSRVGVYLLDKTYFNDLGVKLSLLTEATVNISKVVLS